MRRGEEGHRAAYRSDGKEKAKLKLGCSAVDAKRGVKPGCVEMVGAPPFG